ncbi:hypothetical protein NMG60_11030495 [Bertholletia excelsa]
MEAFSLLRYWRGGSSTTDGGANTADTTIVAVTTHHVTDTDDEEAGDGEDDGPFFDLEFTLPDCEDGEKPAKLEDRDSANSTDDKDEETEGGVDSDGIDCENEGDLRSSPSIDLESNSKSQFFLLKSATKFRVMMLKLKKSKTHVAEKTVAEKNELQNKKDSKLFTVNFRIEEAPLVSLFSKKSQKLQRSSDIGVSKRHFGKLKFTGASSPTNLFPRKSEQVDAAEPPPPACSVKGQKQGSLQARLRVVGKRLGKSQSAPPPVQATRPNVLPLQEQDGIQGAILHCKRSFNSSTENSKNCWKG